jgi:hypothetical protein
MVGVTGFILHVCKAMDYSTVTGILNLMRVSVPEGDSNVYLRWELIDERSGEKPRLMWRVSASQPCFSALADT